MMKQQYETPKAEKFAFDYKNTVRASDVKSVVKNGKTGNAANACYTHNTNTVTSGCEATAK